MIKGDTRSLDNGSRDVLRAGGASGPSSGRSGDGSRV